MHDDQRLLKFQVILEQRRKESTQNFVLDLLASVILSMVKTFTVMFWFTVGHNLSRNSIVKPDMLSEKVY